MKNIRLARSEKLRAGIGALLLTVVLVTLLAEFPAKEKAPVLTLIGGAVVLTGFFPIRRPLREELPGLIGTIAGTIVAIVAAYYWLYDATSGKPFQTLAAVFFGATVLLVLFFIIVGMFWGASSIGQQGDPDVMRRKSIVRRVKRQLNDIARETLSAGGTPYSQYDATIDGLFRSAWSMLDKPYLWTYSPREHQNLIENYLVEWLKHTERAAAEKHPSQCKYAGVAYALAQDAYTLLERISLVTEFDPLPVDCPECRESLPSHKANCMAAICWRCKQATPPQSRDSKNIAVITPMCYMELFCHPRGQQLEPKTAIVNRIALPFGLPPDNESSQALMHGWPTDRRKTKDLLEELQQIEDEITQNNQS